MGKWIYQCLVSISLFTARITWERTVTDDRFCLELFALRYVDTLKLSRGTRGLMPVSLWSFFLEIPFQSFSLLYLVILSKPLDLSCKSLLSTTHLHPSL